MDIFRLLQLSVVAFIIVATNAFEGCRVRYGRRGCYDQVYEGVLVTCDGENRLQKIPDFKIKEDNLVFLQFQNFRFENLTRTDFSRFKSVQCLNIMDSGLSDIRADAFADLESLKELEIINTQLSEMDFLFHPNFRATTITIAKSPHISKMHVIEDITGERKLKALNLADNGITELKGLNVGDMDQLQQLILSGNKLSHLHWKDLTNLRALNKLHLDSNNIQTIPSTMESTFYAVKNLKLGGNPFHCNCKLQWLKSFLDLTRDKMVDYKNVKCASPFKPRNMAKTIASEFQCSTPSTPEIHFYQLNPSSYVVNCSSKGDPAPELQLWLPSNKRLVIPPSEDLAKVVTVTPAIVTNGGKVRCLATNSEGRQAATTILPADSAAQQKAQSTILLLLPMILFLLTSL